ncbi:MAG: FG-GAP repeat domain-containing protein [Tumebacillaceae bacterium]
MQFSVMPDHLFGATVRINGHFLGVVEERPLSFSISKTQEASLLVELAPLAVDPSGDVFPLPLSRIIRLKNNAIESPQVEPDGFLHIRKSGEVHQLHFIYPKVEALDACYETLPIPLQSLTADFDNDGRLDAVETFATNRCGHVRVRSATGAILLQEVFPDNQLHVDIADLNQDGRPDLLIFWEKRERSTSEEGNHLLYWEPATESLSAYEGFTGIRRIGPREVLLERKQATPYWQVTKLFKYTRKEGESAEFLPIRAEEKMLMRAESKEDAVEAFLGLLELGGGDGEKWYVAGNYMSLAEMKRLLGTFYAHEIVKVAGNTVDVRLFEWIEQGYYDKERMVRLELAHLPEKESEWKIVRVISY